MKKDNLISAILGLVVGLVVGFMSANSINKSEFVKQSTTSASTNEANSNRPLPKDHPPIGTSDGEPSSPAGQRPEIAAAIEKARSQPQNYEAQMTAADLYYQIQRFEEAAKFYENAAKLKPANTEPMIKAGNAYFDSEKYEQAEKWYSQALQKEPKNINVRTDLGLTFFLRTPRDIERAIKEYSMSLNLDPDHEITLQNLSLAYSENGDRERFQATIEKLKKVNPNNPILEKTKSR